MATVAYGSQATTVALANSNGHHEQAEEEQYFSTFFCRALYDYQTDNESSLSFRRDDIIEVLTKLESGWWDGLLGQERGWFPSNYVTIISYQEADAAFSTTEAVSGIMHPQFAEEVDVANGLPAHHEWEQQLELPESLPSYSSHDEHPSMPLSHSDFWVPQVSSDGRVRDIHIPEFRIAKDTDRSTT
jgi:son of sevenless-like protein